MEEKIYFWLICAGKANRAVGCVIQKHEMIYI